MMENPNVPCSDRQIAATEQFKDAIYDFLRRNSKYLQPSHELEMTPLDTVLEILELLKASSQERRNVAPTRKTDHQFYKTSG